MLAWIICGLGAIFYCYEYILRIAPSVMSSDIMRTYDIHAGAFGHLSAFYYYAYALVQPLVGLLLDRYGPRYLLTLACLACAVGTYLFIATEIFWIACLGRFLIGLGSGFAFVGALKLASIWLPPNRFAFISGLVNASGMIGAILGDIFLTRLVSSIGWRATNLYAAI